MIIQKFLDWYGAKRFKKMEYDELDRRACLVKFFYEDNHGKTYTREAWYRHRSHMTDEKFLSWLRERELDRSSLNFGNITISPKNMYRIENTITARAMIDPQVKKNMGGDGGLLAEWTWLVRVDEECLLDDSICIEEFSG